MKIKNIEHGLRGINTVYGVVYMKPGESREIVVAGDGDPGDDDTLIVSAVEYEHAKKLECFHFGDGPAPIPSEETRRSMMRSRIGMMANRSSIADVDRAIKDRGLWLWD